MRIILGWYIATLIIVSSIIPAQAATPEQVQNVVKNLPESKSVENFYKRELFIKPFGLEVVLTFRSDDNKGLAPIIHSSNGYYLIYDIDLDGIVDGTLCYCSMGGDGPTKFFAKFGGAQKLYDTIIEESLKDPQ